MLAIRSPHPISVNHPSAIRTMPIPATAPNPIRPLRSADMPAVYGARKAFVRSANQAGSRASDLSPVPSLPRPTRPSPAPAPGDAVVLLSELRSLTTGRVVEIGERGRVVAWHGSLLELVIADGGIVEQVFCTSADVIPEPAGRRTRPAAPWASRLTSAAA